MTERPEERDSLSVEEMDADVQRTYQVAPMYWRALLRRYRALINEVKEREKDLETVWQLADKRGEELQVLEAEVKELREENARLKGVVIEVQRHRIVPESEVLEEAHSRIKQMEEALREARKWCPECGGREYITDPGPPTQQTRQFCPVCRFIRAALSPSDTEEEA